MIRHFLVYNALKIENSGNPSAPTNMICRRYFSKLSCGTFRNLGDSLQNFDGTLQIGRLFSSKSPHII